MLLLALGSIVLVLALGTYSCLVFVWLWIVGAPGQLAAIVLLVATFGASLTLFTHLKRRIVHPAVLFDRYWILLGGVLLYAAYWSFRQVQASPRGGWDGWAIWNLHARFLYHGGAGQWRNLFTDATLWSHPDYPLLLPGLVDGGWTAAGGEHAWIPTLVGALFAVLCVAIVSSCVSLLAGNGGGSLAGLVLLSTPSFLLHANYQMADVPFSLYLLTTIALLLFADIWPNVRTQLLALAGLSAGFAAWTKNEGLLFLCVMFCVLVVRTVLQRPLSYGIRAIALFGGGLIPVLLLVIAFKLFLAPPNDLRPEDSPFVLLTSAGRYPLIVSAFVDHAKAFGGAWGKGVHPFLILALCLVLTASFAIRIRILSLSWLLAPLMMLAGYFLVYVITPRDLTWHLQSSLDRLLLQIWPVSVFIVVSIILTSGGAANVSNSHAPAPSNSSIRS